MSAASACIVCGGLGSLPLYAGILRCPDCSHAFADLQLTDDQLTALYGRDYFFGEEYRDYLADRELARRNFVLRLNELEPFVEPGHRRLFEIGCAYGLFLELARERFESVAGIDISADATRHAREVLGLNAAQGDLLTRDLGSNPYDIVCLWDTLEHLRSPQLYLEKAAAHLRSGGLLALTTVDIESLNARWRGPRWRMIHPPTHLHYFGRRSVERLLDRLGFEVLYSRSCGSYRSIDFAAYRVLALGYNLHPLYQLLRRTGMTSMSFYANLGDIRYVIARRR